MTKHRMNPTQWYSLGTDFPLHYRDTNQEELHEISGDAVCVRNKSSPMCP